MEQENSLKEKLEAKEKADKKRVSIYVKKTTWTEVEKVAKKYDTSVSEAAEELMEEGLKELNIQETKEVEDNKD